MDEGARLPAVVAAAPSALCALRVTRGIQQDYVAPVGVLVWSFNAARGCWSCSVVVSTQDSESCILGSNPSRTIDCVLLCFAMVVFGFSCLEFLVERRFLLSPRPAHFVIWVI